MLDEAGLATIRAAVDAIIPAADGRPGAAELGVATHVVESIELYLPGFADLLSTLLDAYAADVRPGAAFVELTHAEAHQVLEAMSREESPDMQDIVDGLLVFTYGGFYSEWTGYDRTSRTLTPPQAWAGMGFHGPSRGHSEYRVGI
jgi:hypothetical protein